MSIKPKHAKPETAASSWAAQRAERARHSQAALDGEAKRLGQMAYDIGDIMDGIDPSSDPRPGHERRQRRISGASADGRYHSFAYASEGPSIAAESRKGGRHRRTAASAAGHAAIAPNVIIVTSGEEELTPQIDPTANLKGKLTAPYLKPVGNTIVTGDPYRPQHYTDHQGVGVYEWQHGEPAPEAKYYESHPYPQDPES